MAWAVAGDSIRASDGAGEGKGARGLTRHWTGAKMGIGPWLGITLDQAGDRDRSWAVAWDRAGDRYGAWVGTGDEFECQRQCTIGVHSMDKVLGFTGAFHGLPVAFPQATHGPWVIHGQPKGCTWATPMSHPWTTRRQPTGCHQNPIELLWDAHRRPVGYPWTTHGQHAGYPWGPMGHSRVAHGLPKNYPRGPPIGYSWASHELPPISHGISMG